MVKAHDDEFREFVMAVSPQLLHYARLLCGDSQQAEDLVQEALIGVYRRWTTIHTDRLAYTRRAILNRHLSGRRRKRHPEVPLADHDSATTDGEPPDGALVSAMSLLTPRERAVVVLRYHLDLSEHETADYLGVAQGTVKSTTNRAINKLRAALSHTSHQELR